MNLGGPGCKLPVTEERHGVPQGNFKLGARPLHILQMIDCATRAAVRTNQMTELKAHSGDESLRELTKAHFTCVKIKTSPLPYSYAIHLRTLMITYLLALPLVMVHEVRCTPPPPAAAAVPMRGTSVAE